MAKVDSGRLASKILLKRNMHKSCAILELRNKKSKEDCMNSEGLESRNLSI